MGSFIWYSRSGLAQVDVDVAQRLAPSQVGQNHNQELIPIQEVPGLVFAATGRQTAVKRDQ